MNCKGFHHLTWNDRLTLDKMLRAGNSVAVIAEALGFCKKTIYNEIKRGKCVQQTSEYTFEERYCPDVADRIYRENLKAKGPDLKVGRDHAFVDFVERKIMEDAYSPGAVLAEIREGGHSFDTEICESTLYNYIYRGDVFLELTPDHLHEKGRRRYEQSWRQRAARPPQGESIERRPPEIKARTTFGHWEMDSVMGCKGSTRALLVLTERLTRQGIFILLPDHTSNSVVRAINGLERRFGKDFYQLFKSITVDNGCEFSDFAGIEKSCRRKGKRTKVYYCHPYAPHERGSNENMNKLIRRFFPKGFNFDTAQISEVHRAESWINNYPRQILGWKSAEVLFNTARIAA